MYKKIFMIIALALIVSTMIFAEDVLVLTADDSVKAALSNNIGVATEKINLLIKQRTKDTSWNVFIPKISAGATLGWLNADPSLTGVVMVGAVPTVFSQPLPHTFSLSTSLSATLVLSTQIFYGIRQVALDYENGKISYDTAIKKLDRDVRKSFYSILLAEQSIKLMEKNIQSAKTRLEQATINYRSGLVDEYTMLSAQVLYENMKPALEDLKNAYTIAFLSFKLLVGLDLDKEIRLSGTLEDVKPFPLDEKKLVDEYLAQRLDIQSLRYSVMMQENLRDVTQASMYPVLSLMYSFDPTFQKDPFANGWFNDITNDWKQRSGMFGITLSISLDSLIPGSKTQVDLANAQSNLDKIKLALNQAETAAELDIRSIVLKLRKSGETLTTLSLNVALAEKANAMGQEAYKAGIKDYSQIETTEYELQNAQFNLLKEKFNYISGLYDLSYAVNTPIEKVKGSETK
jgi:outer membrane protein TolC